MRSCDRGRAILLADGRLRRFRAQLGPSACFRRGMTRILHVDLRSSRVEEPP